MGELPKVDVNLYGKSSKEEICHYDPLAPTVVFGLKSTISARMNTDKRTVLVGMLKATRDVPG